MDRRNGGEALRCADLDLELIERAHPEIAEQESTHIDGLGIGLLHREPRQQLAHQRIGILDRPVEITFGLLGILRDVPDDEQAVANGAVVSTRQDDMPRTISAPIRMSFAPETTTPGPGPGHGEHTDEVLGELGYSAAELDKLRAAGAFG